MTFRVRLLIVWIVGWVARARARRIPGRITRTSGVAVIACAFARVVGCARSSRLDLSSSRHDSERIRSVSLIILSETRNRKEGVG
jgi:hypothetical protein